jgi:hypothetical protein
MKDFVWDGIKPGDIVILKRDMFLVGERWYLAHNARDLEYDDVFIMNGDIAVIISVIEQTFSACIITPSGVGWTSTAVLDKA